MTLIINDAQINIVEKNYAAALACYEALALKLGFAFFKANISITKKRLEKIGIGTTPIIISLTSYGERVETVHLCIETLLAQTIQADKVILWLSGEEFKYSVSNIPQKLRNLISSRFMVEFTADIKSYKKIIPCLKQYGNTAIIVTADDDILYPPNWLEVLYKSHIRYPSHIIAHRCHRMKYNKKNEILPYNEWEMRFRKHSASHLNFFTGAGGVLYPPKALHSEVINENVFLKYAPTADDIWLWSMAVLNRTKVIIPQDCIYKLNYIEGTQRDQGICVPLHHTNVGKFQNDYQLQNILKHYPTLVEHIFAQDKECDIAYVTDDKMLPITLISIYSLLRNKFFETNYNIHIILNGSQTELVKDFEKKIGIKFDLIVVDSQMIEGMEKKHTKYCTANHTALFKFLLPNLLGNVNTVLYIDSDTLVQQDLSELFSINLQGNSMGCVLDSGCLYSNRFANYSEKYFNSGVMLMDLKKMREENKSDELVYQKKNLDDVSLMDQHVFNIVFSKDFLPMPIKYNFLYTNLMRAKNKFTMAELNKVYGTKYSCIEEVRSTAAILHFASKDKPWKYTNVPGSVEWFDYYSSSELNFLLTQPSENAAW